MTTATKPITKPKQRVHEGVVHVCAHRVLFFYRIPKYTRLSAAFIGRLNEEAEERAKSQIIEGYTQGELNYENGYFDRKNKVHVTFQAWGWWGIER
jgi:hypothetical protein